MLIDDRDRSMKSNFLKTYKMLRVGKYHIIKSEPQVIITAQTVHFAIYFTLIELNATNIFAILFYF